MNTFLPYPDFSRCASVLDGKRLRKQIVEGAQILTTLRLPAGTKAAWVNHPAVAMWRGYEWALVSYLSFVQSESRQRGYTSNITFAIDTSRGWGKLPPWLGHPLLHLSHKANLLRKDPEHYRPHFGVDIEPAQGYWWPIICGPNSKKHTEFWEKNYE